MQLVHDTEYNIRSGTYVITAIVGTGDVTLQANVDGLGYINLPDGALAADDSSKWELPTCKFKVAITGTATASILLFTEFNESTAASDLT